MAKADEFLADQARPRPRQREKFPVTLQMAQILELLHRGGIYYAAQVARSLNIPRATVSQALSRMASVGWLLVEDPEAKWRIEYLLNTAPQVLAEIDSYLQAARSRGYISSDPGPAPSASSTDDPTD